MRALRGFLSWIFALSGFICFSITALGSYGTFVHPLHALSASQVQHRVIGAAVFLLLAVIYGMAWWTNARQKPSLRLWGIAASLTFVALAFLPVAVHRFAISERAGQTPSHPLLFSLGIGLAGMIAFASAKRPEPAARPTKPTPIPGDGTSKLGNLLVGFLAFAASYGIYTWWFQWRHVKGVPRLNGGGLSGLLYLVLIGLAVACLHELGHALTGKALGMKLRAFMVGPIQFVCEQGRWKLKFNLKKILSSGGATGLVPATADFPAASYVRMLAAGPLVNLGTGLAALCIAFAMPGSAPVQAEGLLALFGAFSLLAGVYNLIPFGTPSGYSDGAKIYQVSKGGPWGDFHRAISFAGAGLVTPLRPRDHDIGAIDRAAAGIAQGREGLLLRLFAYNCHLDRSEIDKATFALKQAAEVYEQSACNVAAEVLTVFVFGYACLLRDAAEARKWWERMEAKKPTRFNVDYWRAKSALCWIEGNLKEANQAWDKAAEAALKLPAAGAYEFDRDLCGLMLYEIDASGNGKQLPLAAVASMP